MHLVSGSPTIKHSVPSARYLSERQQTYDSQDNGTQQPLLPFRLSSMARRLASVGS
jgi:hypothetical protein